MSVLVNLKGGLGNQMFQYALGRKLSLKNNDKLKIDPTGLARASQVGDTYRQLSIGHFNIVKEIAAPDEIRRTKYPYGVVSKAERWFRSKILRQNHTLFEPKALEQTGDIFLDGYWQSPKYFEDIRDVLLKDFTLTEPLDDRANDIAEKMMSTTSVSIHVRRGDYVKKPQVHKEFGICSETYYQKAILLVTKRHPGATFFVFSDDIDWVRSNLDIQGEVVYVSYNGLTDAAELYLMSLCKHNIIANSSFSWWAAWLNQNPEKLVIAPTPWFESVPFDKDLIPNTWIQIPKN